MRKVVFHLILSLVFSVNLFALEFSSDANYSSGFKINADEGWDIYVSGGKGDYRYGPSFIVDGHFIEMWTPRAGTNGGWDSISYRNSTDGGQSWSPELIVLEPTPGSRDAYSTCDPGVIKFGGYYYIGYTSTENSAGTDNHLYLARSTSATGPYEKWNGSGWGGNPQPIVEYDGPADRFGVGEPSFVVKDSTVYVYYSESYGKTNVATADINNPNWPDSLVQRGTAILRVKIRQDSSDVKYVESADKFFAVNTAKRFGPDSYVEVWTSLDGINFSHSYDLSSDYKQYIHNMGISGDALGHIKDVNSAFISYAYGYGEMTGGLEDPYWGYWSLYMSPITIFDGPFITKNLGGSIVLDQLAGNNISVEFSCSSSPLAAWYKVQDDQDVLLSEAAPVSMGANVYRAELDPSNVNAGDQIYCAISANNVVASSDIARAVSSEADLGRMNYSVPEGNVNIDGMIDPQEWSGSLVVPASYPETTSAPNSGRVYIGSGPAHDDYVATCYFKWDAENLYLGFYVIDNSQFFINDPASGLNSQDTIQVCFNYMDRTNTKLFEGAIIYDLAANTILNSGPAYFTHTYDFSPFGLYNAQIASTILDHGYMIEIAMPWEELSGGDNYTPAVGDKHGFSLMFMDRDSEDGAVKNFFTDFGRLDQTQDWQYDDWNVIELSGQKNPELVSVTVSANEAVDLCPSIGEHSYNKGTWEIFASEDHIDCPLVYEFDNWVIDGVYMPFKKCNVVLLDKDIDAEAFYSSVVDECGNQCHPYPDGDITRDCVVGIDDLLMFSQQWLQ